MMNKKVSVVVPTYKRPELLVKCLIALSKQDLAKNDFEIVVVSDGPDDATRNMMHNVNHISLPFVQYITLNKNSGPASARNAGWRKANGNLVAFTDDDCTPSPGWLSALWNAYEIHAKSEIAFSGKVIVPISDPPTDYELNTSHLEYADFITANCACTKRALEITNGFDERFKLAWREDSDLEFKLIENNIPIIKVEEAVVVHPVRKVKWGVSITEQRKTMFNALLYKKFPYLFRRKIQRRPAWNYYMIVTGAMLTLAGLIAGKKVLMIIGTLFYIGFTLLFVIKRLWRTSHSRPHVLEMVATSAVIPFVSVYWTLYGAFKYRVVYY
jgi:glycosyltransferase involved in cell wall biosynthesis